MRKTTGGTSNVYYLLSDHLGSTVSVVDADGSSPRNSTYYAFGASRLNGGGALTDKLFTGQQLEASNGLYQMGARWYDPALGRWISPDSTVPDPTHPQKLNRYSYANNNPLRYVDPTGADGLDFNAVRGGITVVGDFAGGFIDASRDTMTVNLSTAVENAFQVQRPDSEAYAAGRIAGDIVGTAQGGAMFLQGGAEVIGGILGGGATCPVTAGAGCAAGAIVAAGGVVEAGIGAAVVNAGYNNLQNDVNQFNSQTQKHHIATNKNSLAGSRWTPQFEELFKKGGLSLDDAVNKVDLPQHKGRHPEAYHKMIYDKLTNAIKGLDNEQEIGVALQTQLKAVADDLKVHPEWVNSPPAALP